MARTTIPLFPLGTVLFPGTAMPLHIFEPRYRQMLADIRAGDQRFALMPLHSGERSETLPTGRIGCVAEVTDVEMLPDGRANIIVHGRERVIFVESVDADSLYRQGMVEPLPDEPDVNAIAIALQADELAANFRRVVSAVQRLSDQPASAPSLPDAPAHLPWAIAAMIDLDVMQRSALLAERRSSNRLAQVDGIIRRVLPDLELRAAAHNI
ncbi:MAG: LON peptidase substrate-binding domain-containing protein [Gemmatimonadaceae bacterium]|nr:LON peptidase substrate-binding domain-containing protein [Gemmatimonadaceae bacterium]